VLKDDAASKVFVKLPGPVDVIEPVLKVAFAK